MKLHMKQAKHITHPHPPSGGGGKTKGAQTGLSFFCGVLILESVFSIVARIITNSSYLSILKQMYMVFLRMSIFWPVYFFRLGNRYINEQFMSCFFMWFHSASSCDSRKNFRFIRNAINKTSNSFATFISF